MPPRMCFVGKSGGGNCRTPATTTGSCAGMPNEYNLDKYDFGQAKMEMALVVAINQA